MASWWRRFAEAIGAEPNGRSWRQVAIDHSGLIRSDLVESSGGWDRRIVTYYDRIPGTGPWARHLVGDEVTSGVVHNGEPVFFNGVRVVHNG